MFQRCVLPPSSGMSDLSETSVENYFTWQYIPEDNSELHIHLRENLKSHTTLHQYKDQLVNAV
jgi:hypothetical protein